MLEAQTLSPTFWDNHAAAQATMRKIERLKHPLEHLASIGNRLDDAEVMVELAAEADDAEALNEADAMLSEALRQLAAFERERLLSGELDNANAIVTVQAGAGGTEAADWAEMLLRMLLRFAERQGWETTLVEVTPGDEAGIKSATFIAAGAYAFGYLKAESGVHRLVRISPYDASARRHTSFAAVFVVPEIDDDVEVNIDPKDLRIDTYRASGAGGQHVNKTDSAVRITHIPSGIVVSCQNERSQHQNRDMAMRLLRARLYELERERREAELESHIAERKKIEWGSQIRSYVLHPYKLVKDHRTGVETSSVQAVLDGDLEPFIDAWLRQRAGEQAVAD